MFTGELRWYQQGPCLQMIRNKKYLLALVVGSGKTETAIAAAEDLLECRHATQILVVTTEGTKLQWRDRILSRTDHDSVMLIEGSPDERAQQYRIAKTGAPKYVIANYEQLVAQYRYGHDAGGHLVSKTLVRDELPEFQAMPATVCILDEASHIRNDAAARSNAMLGIQTEWRWALTATPVENKLLDLWGIMRWVDPNLFGERDLFERAFLVKDYNGIARRVRNMPLLRNMMQGRWAVVNRAMIADQLPDFSGVDEVSVPIDANARLLYNDVADELLDALEDAYRITGGKVNLWAGAVGGKDDDSKAALGAVMSRFMALRQLSSDPRSCRESARRYEESDGDKGSEYAYDLASRGFFADLPETTPKIEYLKDTIKSPTVVFTAFSTTASLITDALGDRAVVYHGSRSKRQRREALDLFKSGKKQILVATDAGGYGLDLPEANRIINHDLAWGGGAMTQRDGRHDRVSSVHARITVERLLTESTVDEWMADKVNVKQRLALAATEGKHLDRGGMDASGDSLTDFLNTTRP